MAVVVDSNKNDELAVVKLTTSQKGKPIKDKNIKKSKYKPYVETRDYKGKAIKTSSKFDLDKKKVISPFAVNDIKKIA